MDPLLVKVLFTVTIFVAAWWGGWLPRRLGARGVGELVMRLGNALAAGIFLGTGLIHLLPEAHDSFRGLGWSFPMASLLAACGFMTLLLLEHVLMPQSMHSVVHAHSGEPLAGDGARSLVRDGVGLLCAFAQRPRNKLTVGRRVDLDR